MVAVKPTGPTRSSMLPRRAFGMSILLLAVGCGDRAARGPEPLRIAAASDLQAALPVLVSRFKLDRGFTVEFTTGSSGQLARQIRQGAPFDVFLSANRQYVEELAKEGVIRPDSVSPYARGT